MTQTHQQLKQINPTKYFDLIQKVGSNGVYQRNMMLIFALQWYVTAILLLGTSFLFMNQDFDCLGNQIVSDNCEATICSMNEDQWPKFIGQKYVNSLATDFGPFYCQKGNIKLDSYKMIIYGGTFVGYFVFLFITDNYGRKFAMVIGWAVTFVGILILCLSSSMGIACIGLFFAGSGCDACLRITMAMLTQIVQYTQRQKYSVLLEVCFGLSGTSLGIIYWIFRDWRIVNTLFALVPAFIALVLIIVYIEETPKFLIKKMENKAVRNALNRIAFINQGDSDRITEEDIQKVKKNEEQDQVSKDFVVNPCHLLSFKSLRSKTITTCLIFCFINYLYLGPIAIVKDLGIDPFISQTVLSFSELIAYPISYVFISRIPRIRSGFILIGISTIFTSILTFVEKPQNCNGCMAGIIEILLTFGSRFVVSFYYSVFFIYMVEIYPMRARGLGFGMASAFGAIGSTSSFFVFPLMQELKINPMILFTIIGILHLITLKFMKETLNKPLETEIKEIRKIMANRKEQIRLESPTDQRYCKQIQLVEEQVPDSLEK